MDALQKCLRHTGRRKELALQKEIAQKLVHTFKTTQQVSTVSLKIAYLLDNSDKSLGVKRRRLLRVLDLEAEKTEAE